jgi:hypothetical protein
MLAQILCSKAKTTYVFYLQNLFQKDRDIFLSLDLWLRLTLSVGTDLVPTHHDTWQERIELLWLISVRIAGLLKEPFKQTENYK